MKHSYLQGSSGLVSRGRDHQDTGVERNVLGPQFGGYSFLSCSNIDKVSLEPSYQNGHLYSDAWLTTAFWIFHVRVKKMCDMYHQESKTVPESVTDSMTKRKASKYCAASRQKYHPLCFPDEGEIIAKIITQ
ncbi:Olfactory Receptor 14I1 [Manis pentadactyla]|nr:Olfactory Receptor 14I1 [Manis pentadactyla]